MTEEARVAMNRLIEYHEYVEKYGMKTTQTEEWEIVQVKSNKNKQYTQEGWLNCQRSAYVLLHKQRTNDVGYSDEIRITIIPIIEVDDGYVQQFDTNRIDRRTWSAYADVIRQRIDFANYGPFIIEPKELRGRGLGSLFFNHLIRWGRQYYPEFAFNLTIAAIEEIESPAAQKRLKQFYRNFGADTAKKVSELYENFDSNKVRSWSLEEFIEEILKENSKLCRENKDLGQQQEELIAEIERLKQRLRYVIVIAAFSFTVLITILCSV